MGCSLLRQPLCILCVRQCRVHWLRLLGQVMRCLPSTGVAILFQKLSTSVPIAICEVHSMLYLRLVSSG